MCIKKTQSFSRIFYFSQLEMVKKILVQNLIEMNTLNRAEVFNRGTNQVRKERKERIAQRIRPYNQHVNRPAERDKALRTPQSHLLDPKLSSKSFELSARQLNLILFFSNISSFVLAQFEIKL